jgi:hypothetical protein
VLLHRIDAGNREFKAKHVQQFVLKCAIAE